MPPRFLLPLALLLLLPRTAPADTCRPGDGALAASARLVGLEVGAAIDHDLEAFRRALAASEFTSATVENSLKWQSLSPAPGVYDFDRADAAVSFAEQSGLRVRGHTLFWARLNGLPGWLAGEIAAAPDPAAQLTLRMQQHARTLVGRYRGRLAQWDVVNEPLATLSGSPDPQSLFQQVLGESYLDIAFAAAHEADPGARLFLNETLAELLPAKFEGLVRLVERLLARGVPIDGVGLQGHFFFRPPDRAVLQAQLERIGSLGLQVELTEVDIPLALFASAQDPLAAQARAWADVFAACLAVPACTGVTGWGIDDGDSWLDDFALTRANAPNRPLLFDATGAPKPAYHAVVAALETSVGALEVDVRPGDERNAVNPASRGVVPVVIRGGPGLDVGEIDPASLAFGPGCAGLAHARGPHEGDVDGDGWPDLLAHFAARESGLAFGDTEVCLLGRRRDGAALRGCDAVTTLPACGLGFELPLLLAALALVRRGWRLPGGRPAA